MSRRRLRATRAITINQVVLTMLLATCAGVAAIGVLRWRDARSAETGARRASLVRLTETAAAVIDGYVKRSQGADAATVAQAKRDAAAVVGTMRYGTSDYFWIDDMTPRMVMHPIKPELDGQDLRGYKDPTGRPLFVEMVATVRAHGRGFESYRWPRVGSEKPVPKLAYVIGIPDWGWVVGTGVYVDDIDAAVRARQIEVLWQTLLILGVDHFLDMGRSATNVVGNSVATAVVAKWEKELGPEQADAPAPAAKAPPLEDAGDIEIGR